jgi:hypothetical protein
MSSDLEQVGSRMLQGLLRRTHLSKPDELADVVADELEGSLGATAVVLYLTNYEQTALVPVPSGRSPARPEQPMEGTMVGRAFTMSEIHSVAGDEPSLRRVLLPVMDGTDRLGVLEVSLDVDRVTGDAQELDGAVAGLPVPLARLLERYAHAVAQAVFSKSQYGDVFELVRRTRPMTVGAELLWSVLPPPTYATDGLVISAMLEPAYLNGGDAYDYAVNRDRAHLAVFDGMGHGLNAAGSATFAVAAYRHSRRTKLTLAESYVAMDAAVTNQFGGDQFVTAILVELDLHDGRLRWLSAGHPPPLLVRDGRVIKALEVEPATPLGVPNVQGDIVVGEESLETGDSLLLYTDGLTEARQPDGELLGLDALAEFVGREAAARRPTPETLRRLRRAILNHQEGVLQDDATALLVDWRRGSEESLVPQTVIDEP